MANEKHLTCECVVRYHDVVMPDGNRVCVPDEPMPVFATMMWGRCERCKLPYHTEFSTDEPR